MAKQIFSVLREGCEGWAVVEGSGRRRQVSEDPGLERTYVLPVSLGYALICQGWQTAREGETPSPADGAGSGYGGGGKPKEGEELRFCIIQWILFYLCIWS